MGPWLAILNQQAGSRPTRRRDVVGALDTAGVQAEIITPPTASAASEAIEEAVRSGQSRFVAVGGDGTVNLLVNALMNARAESPVIAVLPAGTGCDLIRTFGIPQTLQGAAAHLATDETYPIDIGVLEGEWGTRYFVNVAQTGAGAAAAQTAPAFPRWFGPVRYPLAFAARLPGFPRTQVKLTTERRNREQSGLAVILANAQFFAGGWNVAPKATLVDGVLDIQIIDAPKTRAPALVPKIIKGNHLTDSAVRRTMAGEFRVETDEPWPVEADGEFLGNTPFTGRVIPAAIRLKI